MAKPERATRRMLFFSLWPTNNWLVPDKGPGVEPSRLVVPALPERAPLKTPSRSEILLSRSGLGTQHR
jgi:hypothetical protein